MADDLTRTRRRFVALTALRWFPTGVVLPVMVLLMRQRGLDLGEVGMVLAVYSLVTAALELPTGGLADVIGRRPVLVISALPSMRTGLATRRLSGDSGVTRLRRVGWGSGRRG